MQGYQKKEVLFVCQYQNQSSVVECWKLKCRFVKVQRPVERGAQRWACPDTVACGFTFFPQTPPHRFQRIDLSDLTSGLSLIPAPLTRGCSNLPLSVLLSADLNECGLKPRPCKHRCMNTYGSYKCYCLNGYMLLPDGSCGSESRLVVLHVVSNCVNRCLVQ